MSDKHPIELYEEAPQPKSSKKRWLIFLSLFLIVLLLLSWFLLSNSTALDGVKRFFRYLGRNREQYGRLQFETYGSTTYALTEDRFAVATQNGTLLFAEDGSVLGRVQGSFSAPALNGEGDYLLSYDIGGTRLALLDSEGETLFNLTVGGPIFDADLSENGYTAVLYEGKDSNATLEVYERGGKLLYRRNAKTTYLNACAISPDGAVAVAATLGQSDASFASGLQFLPTAQEEIGAEITVGSDIIYDLAFLKDTICAVSDGGLKFFDTDGSPCGEYALADAQLSAYSFGDGFVSLLVNPYEAGSSARLVTLDADAAVIAETEITAAPMDLSACGSYVAVLCEQTLYVYDRGLSLRGSTENTGYTAVRVRSDGTTFCISTGEAELYIP